MMEGVEKELYLDLKKYWKFGGAGDDQSSDEYE